MSCAQNARSRHKKQRNHSYNRHLLKELIIIKTLIKDCFRDLVKILIKQRIIRMFKMITKLKNRRKILFVIKKSSSTFRHDIRT